MIVIRYLSYCTHFLEFVECSIPYFGVLRFETSSFNGVANELAHSFDAIDKAIGLCLNHHISNGSAFAWTGNYRHANGVAGELVEQVVARAATDNV